MGKEVIVLALVPGPVLEQAGPEQLLEASDPEHRPVNQPGSFEQHTHGSQCGAVPDLPI
jgi:hypothetical protein